MFNDNNFFSGGSGPFYSYTIDDSLRFNDNDSAYLSWTPASAGSRTTFTISTWLKRGNIGVTQTISGARVDGNNYNNFYINSSDKLVCEGWVSAQQRVALTTTQVFRDVSSWYHIVIQSDSTNATSTDRFKIYVNGKRVTAFDTAVYPSQNFFVGTYNTAVTHNIGRYLLAIDYFDGYLAETHFTDGTAYDASAFGEFKSGVWIPKSPSVTYGTNGFYLPFSGNTNDASGNGNNWTATNISAHDYVPDSPTNNFATLNKLKTFAANFAFQEGNLEASDSSTTNATAVTTIPIAPNSGKFYWEIYIASNPSSGSTGVGVALESDVNTVTLLGGNDGSYRSSGTISDPTGSAQTSGSTYTSNDIISIAYDSGTGQCQFYKNNVAQGATPSFTYSGSENLIPHIYQDNVSGTKTLVVNFGQDSTFAGLTTAGGNTDANGIGDFKYAPPSGYLALCTANLPEPAISPANDESPSDHFNAVLWNGDGTEPEAITGVGFKPDFTWIKSRTFANSHTLFDFVRGAGSTKGLCTNATVAEGAYSQLYGYISSFDSDGFTLAAGTTNDHDVNRSGAAMVAWNWKANNTAGSSNTNGTITSTVAANTAAGFSIIKYTGNATAGATVGHGLSQAPEMLIFKLYSTTSNWIVYHESLGANQYLILNSTAAQDGTLAPLNDVAPSSSVITLGGTAQGSNDGSMICYAFHSVEGYSKFGKYTGNGSADGPFVYTGFRPAFVMIKNANLAGSYWEIYDDKREGYNVDNDGLFPNENIVEGTSDILDLVSNGFKIRTTGVWENTNGHTIIYMAFAENPFKYANAR